MRSSMHEDDATKQRKLAPRIGLEHTPAEGGVRRDQSDDDADSRPRAITHTDRRRQARTRWPRPRRKGDCTLAARRWFRGHLHRSPPNSRTDRSHCDTRRCSDHRPLDPLWGPYAPLYLSLIHISEPTRQAEISYAVFCLKKKKKQ